MNAVDLNMLGGASRRKTRSTKTHLKAGQQGFTRPGHSFDALEASKEAIVGALNATGCILRCLCRHSKEYCRFEGLANQEAALASRSERDAWSARGVPSWCGLVGWHCAAAPRCSAGVSGNFGRRPPGERRAALRSAKRDAAPRRAFSPASSALRSARMRGRAERSAESGQRGAWPFVRAGSRTEDLHIAARRTIVPGGL